MLVQTAKSKRASWVPRKPPIKSPLTNEKSTDSVIDKTYERFYESRRSEEVFKIIDTALQSSDTTLPVQSSQTGVYDIGEKPVLSEFKLSKKPISSELKMSEKPILSELAMERSKQISKDWKRLGSKLKANNNYAPIENVEANNEIKALRLESKLQEATSEIKIGEDRVLNLQDENRTLRNYLSFVYEHMAHEEDTKNIKKTELHKRFNNAVLEYRLEIYQNRSRKYKETSTSYLERNAVLEEIVVDVKVENCIIRTDNERIRLQVDDLQNHFNLIEEYFLDLSSKLENKFTTYQARLDNAFEKIYQLKCVEKKRRFSLFKKKKNDQN